MINTGMGSLIRGQTDFVVREDDWFIYNIDLDKYFIDNDKGDRKIV